jgi:L,D-peptidoglycan transpeptidase YkuD (ErfK/YbiS/YcfS/YnhG family)
VAKGRARNGLTRLRATRAFGPPGRGRLHAGGLALPCALGPAGVKRLKREGDGATPAGRFRLLDAYWRADRAPRPRLFLPLAAIRPGDLWCDDPGAALYNRPARAPLKAGCEQMRRADRLYDVVVTLDHNQRPRVRGLGSAIFFHIAREGFAPTQGCVAIAPEAMRRLLPRLSRRAVLVID